MADVIMQVQIKGGAVEKINLTQQTDSEEECRGLFENFTELMVNIDTPNAVGHIMGFNEYDAFVVIPGSSISYIGFSNVPEEWRG